jgi:hypothetical protein
MPPISRRIYTPEERRLNNEQTGIQESVRGRRQHVAELMRIAVPYKEEFKWFGAVLLSNKPRMRKSTTYNGHGEPSHLKTKAMYYRGRGCSSVYLYTQLLELLDEKKDKPIEDPVLRVVAADGDLSYKEGNKLWTPKDFEHYHTIGEQVESITNVEYTVNAFDVSGPNSSL